MVYDDRMKRYADSTFLPTTFEIHWLSVLNSFVLVLLLTAFLAIILMKILKNDFSKYMEIDEDELTEEVNEGFNMCCTLYTVLNVINNDQYTI